MTPEQRAAALRLTDALYSVAGRHSAIERDTVALLRELAREPDVLEAGRRADALAEQLYCVRQALPEEWRDSVPSVAVATLTAELALLRKIAAEPMRCPTDGGACGAGGYCRPEPQGEVARLRADAECFRWLLAGNGYFMEHEMLCGHKPCSEEEQDDARRVIRAAMEEETP